MVLRRARCPTSTPYRLDAREAIQHEAAAHFFRSIHFALDGGERLKEKNLAGAWRETFDHAQQARIFASIDGDLLGRRCSIGNGERGFVRDLEFDPVAGMALVVECKVRGDAEEVARGFSTPAPSPAKAGLLAARSQVF